MFIDLNENLIKILSSAASDAGVTPTEYITSHITSDLLEYFRNRLVSKDVQDTSSKISNFNKDILSEDEEVKIRISNDIDNILS